MTWNDSTSRCLQILAGIVSAALPWMLNGITYAQGYPAKPVRVVIPWPPGGANDIAGRTVMQKVGEATGQTFIIDNRGGAGGTIGTDYVAKSLPDGYTLLVQSVTHVANAHLYRSLPYETLRDFAPVALLTAQTAVLVVHPSLPVKSVKEFIALVRSRPEQLMYSTAGNGSIPHLSMALLASTTGTRLVHVPYKGGGPQVVGLLGGETQASLATIASVIPHIRAGRLRALGVASARRSPTLPEVPTIAEAGVPGYELSPWIGLLAPAATPRTVVDRLNTEVNRALKVPDVALTLSGQALDPWGGTPEEFGARLKADFEKYGKLIALTGARVD
ncbi:MAG: tripartite tricarboxylate transporter substrate binding protein [Proteobacteria bacterium]|nr:tripartite tricarboxylate transporter substrate binding protein [Burkholderiales bacterium]